MYESNDCDSKIVFLLIIYDIIGSTTHSIIFGLPWITYPIIVGLTKRKSILSDSLSGLISETFGGKLQACPIGATFVADVDNGPNLELGLGESIWAHWKVTGCKNFFPQPVKPWVTEFLSNRE